MSDDENQAGESYTIVSETNLEHASTDTLSDLVFQIHELVHGKKRDLDLLRRLTEDIWSLVAINEDAQMSDALDGLDLPDGWSSDIDDEPDDGE